MDESGPDPAAFKELHSATDLALHATAQAICRSMASLVVLERHMWLNLMEIKEADKVPFLDSLVSPTGLFGLAHEDIAESFTAAQKSSLAMRHFLPKHSSSVAASSRPKMAPTQQLEKPAPPAAQLAAKPEPRHRSHSARPQPFPKCQEPRPKIVLDPVLRRLPDLRDRKRKGTSLAAAGLPLKQPLLFLQALRSVLGADDNVFVRIPLWTLGLYQ